MKQLLIVLFLCIALSCGAQDIVRTNAVSVAWDIVTTLSDGTEIPATDTIEYEVFIALNKDVPISQGRTDLLSYTIVFDQEGLYAIGVRTIRIQDSEESFSEINWSDEQEGVVTTFLVRYMKPPTAPGNFMIE